MSATKRSKIQRKICIREINLSISLYVVLTFSIVVFYSASFLVMEKSLLSNNQFYHNGFTTSYRRDFITNTAKLPLETVKKLIAAVGKKPDLWDRYYGKYGKKRCDHNLLWRDISAEVNLPVEICRTKWGHLRDNFRKVFIRNTLSDETPTSWRFYNDMRFMEKTILSNIEFKNRHKGQNRNHKLYQKQQNCETLREVGQSENAIRAIGYNFQEESQSISENTSLNNDIYNTELPAFKRIKLEPPETEPEKEHQGYNNYFESNTLPALPPLTTAANVPSHRQLQDTEDIITANEPLDCYTNHLPFHQSKSNSQIYTIEMFDEEQPRELFAPERQRSNKKDEYIRRNHAKLCNPGTNFSMDNAPVNRSDDQDTDRLFLLSLLPYLQSIPLQRKLHVRQKLQSVLIDETTNI